MPFLAFSPELVDFPPIALRRPVLGRRGEKKPSFAFFDELLPPFAACFCLAVQSLGNGGWPSYVAQSENFNFEFSAASFNVQEIADVHLARRFDQLFAAFDPAKFARLRRQAASFEEARCPKPFVDAYSGHGLNTSGFRCDLGILCELCG